MRRPIKSGVEKNTTLSTIRASSFFPSQRFVSKVYFIFWAFPEIIYDFFSIRFVVDVPLHKKSTTERTRNDEANTFIKHTRLQINASAASSLYGELTIVAISRDLRKYFVYQLIKNGEAWSVKIQDSNTWDENEQQEKQNPLIRESLMK